MTRSTQKNLAAYEGTWFGNIHGNNLQDPWSKKEVSQTDWLEVRVLPAPPQSCTNGDFPVQCESPRIGGDLCTHFISAIRRLDCRDRFGGFVSALENYVSRRRGLALVETRFECWVSATESQASHAALTILVRPRPTDRQLGPVSKYRIARERCLSVTRTASGVKS
jgi:hypothetical protein